MKVVITKEFFEEGRSKRGGWTHKQTDCLGIERPYKAGWRGRVVGTEVPYEAAHKFLSLSNRFAGMSYEAVSEVLNRYCAANVCAPKSQTAYTSMHYPHQLEKMLGQKSRGEIEQLLMRALASSGRLGDVVEAADLCRRVTDRIEAILKANRSLA